jgi:hypothetical protein
MSQPDPEAMKLGDENPSKEGAAKGYGIAYPTILGGI